jgi:hypothetical protein
VRNGGSYAGIQGITLLNCQKLRQGGGKAEVAPAVTLGPHLTGSEISTIEPMPPRDPDMQKEKIA